MLGTHLMECTDDGSLQEAPNALGAVGVHVTAYPFLDAMIDSLVPSVLIRDPLVGPPFVGVDGGRIGRNALADDRVQGLALTVGDHLESHGAAALDDA